MSFQPDIPGKPGRILSKLHEAGFEAYLVGGCIRDALIGLPSLDFDITTSARPEEIKKLFPNSREVGLAFAVMLVDGYEVATFRQDGAYSDFRHPDSIAYAATIEEDLSRRDFTVNAMAYDGKRLVDPFDGRKDLENLTIRFVGDPRERMHEDPIRAIRACRFAAKIGAEIEEKSASAIREMRSLLDHVAAERKQQELTKMLMGPNPDVALEWVAELGLLIYLLPEMEASRGCDQPPFHPEDCWEHALTTLSWAVKPLLPLRLACLMHDVAKPACKASNGKGGFTFYNHDAYSKEPIETALKRLKYSNEIIGQVLEYAKYHMRPLLFECGMKEPAIQKLMGTLKFITIRDLLRFMLCDVRGNTKYKDKTFAFILEIARPAMEKIRLIERENRVLRISDLPVSGADLMQELNIQPGPLVGRILNGLYDYALKHPKADRDCLLKHASQLLHLQSIEE